jgi:EAL domain-containing protein (putative c-di-GMP-specific phosphodiesterase class I)
MLATLHEFVQALEQDQVIPAFQPIVELRTGKLRGFEVLARWAHPKLGPVLPENLIALAEDNGLIGELTNRVFRKAFLAARSLGDLRIAVNVSPRQMRYASLPGQIRNSAEDAGFSLQQLTIEITESALLENLEQAGKIACALKEMGCRLSLDDFGTGYSSLKHLQALPFDQIKIDRSFVESMATRRESRKIVAAIVGLGHSLDLITVAEGVEEDEQAELLVRLGCQLAQGFRYGRPLPEDSLQKVMAAQPISVAIRASEDAILDALPAQRLAEMQAIYDGAPVGLCFVDHALRYVSLNRRLAKMHCLPVEEHLGQSIGTLFPEWYKRHEGYLQAALGGEPVDRIEIQEPGEYRGRPGRKVLASFYPVRDEAEEVIGISMALMEMRRRTMPSAEEAAAAELALEAQEL